ncbi:rhodanese-like domain-containing protein [Streptomyces sp. NPDC004435]|uniref:rhodanese-like domain-containing protein n=1 Tax=Streptomyces sp. NPDC004435 TaxID=3364701 RepID=UPI0036805754
MSDGPPEPGDSAALTPAALRELLDRRAPLDLIDVREPHEWELVRIPGARLVPQASWLDGSALPTLRADRLPVFYCRTGVRTRAVLAAVHEAGFTDAVHLQGGVVAWTAETTPGPPGH